jgi:glycosyltransferase involved in cell wall biosynthesis
VSQAIVSVIIPTFNRADRLPSAIRSLQAQTYTDWEALVIDDGSTDSTAEVMAAFRAQDPRVRYHRQENRGVSAARNAGLALADGAWIGFLDSDDSWAPWKLSAQMACFRALPEVGMVWTDMDAVDSAGALIAPRYLRTMYSAYHRARHRTIFSDHCPLSTLAPELVRAIPLDSDTSVRWGDVYSTMILGNIVHTSTVVMTRQRARETGLFNEAFRTGEDYDFHLRCSSHGAVALLDAPAVHYRVSVDEDQLTAPGRMLEMARNGLRTQEAALTRDRGRIDLTDAEIAQTLASMNAWIASELFDRREYAESRAHFRRAFLDLRTNPRQLTKAAIAHLPPRFAAVLSRILQRRGSA